MKVEQKKYSKCKAISIQVSRVRNDDDDDDDDCYVKMDLNGVNVLLEAAAAETKTGKKLRDLK